MRIAEEREAYKKTYSEIEECVHAYYSFVERRVADFAYKCVRKKRTGFVHGGRACINIANLVVRYVPLSAFITCDMIDLGFLIRGHIDLEQTSQRGSVLCMGQLAFAIESSQS